MLAVLTINTGYFEDRLQPALTLVYDFGSNSAAVIPQVTYRYSSNFSATVGLAFFEGREEPRADVPLPDGRSPTGPGAAPTTTSSRTASRRCATGTRSSCKIRYTF